MHHLTPFLRWEKHYCPDQDPKTPFYGATYDSICRDAIYGYYIHPLWDAFGSETLYLKILYADYAAGTCIIELFGEWNDTLHNDVMHLKRNVIDALLEKGLRKFILIGENVLNFHGSDDCYYEEWFEEVSEEGWIAALCFREHVLQEMSEYGIDFYLISGGELDELDQWRTASHPRQLIRVVQQEIQKRISLC